MQICTAYPEKVILNVSWGKRSQKNLFCDYGFLYAGTIVNISQYTLDLLQICRNVFCVFINK